MIVFVEKMQALLREKKSFVVVTLIQIKGSAPQIEGAKMLVTHEGLYWGTVGGGKIEAHCLSHAKDLLAHHGTPESKTWNLQKDIGMSCGGEVTLFFDVHLSDPLHIAIFGAGHIAQELCRVLSSWPCQISIYDTRADWLEKLPAFPQLEKKLSSDLAEDARNLRSDTYLLSMTQGHATDLPLLKAALLHHEHLPFVGVIGSDIKAAKIKKELLEFGISENKVQQLASPLGLPIGNNTPSEIAISICAQILCVRDHSTFTLNSGKLLS